MTRPRPLWILLGVLAAALAAGIFSWTRTASDVRPLIARAERAAGDVPRVGRMRVTTWCDDRHVVSLLDVAYGTHGRHRLEYRTPPLDGVVCVADPPHLWRLDPRRQAVEEAWSDGGPRGNLALLFQNYDVRWKGYDTVAGRAVDRVELTRKHHRGGVARRLWLDRATGLPLRTQEFDVHGKLVCTTEYLKVAFVDPPRQQFARPSLPGARLAAVRRAAVRPCDCGTKLEKPILPRYLPAGYRLHGTGVFRCFCGCGGHSLHTRFVDGLESLSLFECGHTTRGVPERAAANVGHDCVATTAHKGHTFIAVGRVHLDELERMLASLP